MRVVVLGATGATGRLAVKQLLDAGCEVIALVRTTDVLAEHHGLTQMTKTALTIEEGELKSILAKSDAAICCLGHNLTLQGVYGAPRMLVRDSIKRLADSITTERSRPFKLALMSSTGVRNREAGEKVTSKEKAVVSLLRWLLPPHRDNEQAAKLLQRMGTKNKPLEWVIVRPDTLLDQSEVSEYQWHQSPTRSALFDAGETSRVNVANALCRLVMEEDLWQKWRGQTPVIYNQV
ncbi:NAD(P)-dependent oxidoreductase [Vibrio atypicus]|uniref:NAD(P)-dependent oxidoreductase n=1 Tax=Vibrio atypicus TaxID=558271 RepID=UPI001359630E|nr:NAD(P)H-binding protein [Vibrio atypicus]